MKDMLAFHYHHEEIFEDYKVRENLQKYCDALLLQFTEPKVYDLSMPCGGNIYDLVKLSTKILSGENVEKEKVNCMTYKENLHLKDLKIVLKDKNLSENILLCLYLPNNHYTIHHSILEEYLNHRDVFRKEWFHGKGEWYEFRTGEREKCEQRVLENLASEEFAKIQKIGNAFQPFIGLTDSPAKFDT